MEHEPALVLLIEDNPGDADLVRLRLVETESDVHVNCVPRLADALACLDVETPSLVLLDLNLPKKDGRQVLAEIKEDESFKRIPVVILNTSIAEEDIFKSYNLHANCYITKPIDLHRFIKAVHAIEEFWFTIVKLPPNEDKK